MMTARSSLVTGLATASLLTLLGCGESLGGGSSSSADGLLLAKSLSTRKGVNEGAFLLMRPGGPDGTWTRELVVDAAGDDKAGSFVMHKALWFEPEVGDPGVLTCSADDAKLSIWRENGGSWNEEVLWTGLLGEKNHRLRDMEIADVTGDGIVDICLATHDLSKVFIVEQNNGEYTVDWVDEGTTERYFVHEMEVGDVDGDGVAEMYTTPSLPNTSNGEQQAGDIAMYKKDGDGWKKTYIERFETRHAKEILIYDLDQDGTPELYASLEGEGIVLGGPNAGGEGDPTFIKRYVWKDGEFVAEDIMELPGYLCRFLNGGDTDGDGQHEIIASTDSKGIFKIFQDGDGWKRRPVLISSRSSGFEHATILHDWDGDGIDDVFVASDNQKTLQRVTWNTERSKYDREVLFDFAPPKGQNYDYFTWNMTILPAGK